MSTNVSPDEHFVALQNESGDVRLFRASPAIDQIPAYDVAPEDRTAADDFGALRPLYFAGPNVGRWVPSPTSESPCRVRVTSKVTQRSRHLLLAHLSDPDGRMWSASYSSDDEQLHLWPTPMARRVVPGQPWPPDPPREYLSATSPQEAFDRVRSKVVSDGWSWGPSEP